MLSAIGVKHDSRDWVELEFDRVLSRALGVPTGANPGDVAALRRFQAKVQITANGCHLWTAAIGRNGYGIFHFDGRLVLAHRWKWELERGPVPPGHVLDHRCRNRACVNDAHLEAVTSAENTRRGVEARRAAA